MKELNKKSVYSVSTDLEIDEVLLKPYFHIIQGPEKKLRANLVHAYNHWFKLSSDKLNVICEVIQMIHNASLLIDDIQDGSTLRRGIPSAHDVYGVGITVNAAFHVVFLAIEKLSSLNNIQVVKAFTEQAIELCRGQGIDIYWRNYMISPTEEEYKKMTIQKTGGLFFMALQIMQVLSDNKSDFRKLTELMALYRQIRDDYYNLKSEKYFASKTYCDDLTEGKFSFPIIHAIQTHPENVDIIDILAQHTTDDEVKRHFVSLLEEYGSFEYTRNMLGDIDKEIRMEIEKLGGNPVLISLIEKSWGDDAVED